MASRPPNRPLPAGVYRRRRIVVFLGALLAGAALVWGIWWLATEQPWRSWVAEGAIPTPSASASPTLAPAPIVTEVSTPEETPEPSGTPADVEPCTADDVSVEALVDREIYAAGEEPELRIRLSNVSGIPCTLDVGSAQQTYTVSSGDDVWWRSTDCQVEPSDVSATITPGQVVESVSPVVWDRTRSAADTCEDVRPVAPAEGAVYAVQVSIGGIPATALTTFTLE